MAPEPTPIDSQQVATIARVHHGMLYQHVLAACFVAQHALEPFYQRLIVERDEDVEVVCDSARHYLQVKVEDGLKFSELYRDARASARKQALSEAGGCAPLDPS